MMRSRRQDPPPTDPTVPAPGFFPDYPTAWKAMHNQLKSQARRSKARVVFLGDSITQGWLDPNGGKKEWDRAIAPLGALNLGIGGDKTNQILWRINDGVLDGLTPQVVVLAIGVNNLWKNDAGNARISEGIVACVTAVRTKCPQASVVVVGIFPTQNPASHPLRATVAEINQRTAEALAKKPLVRFVEFGAKFLQPDGTLPKEISPDALHLATPGYVIYRTELLPVISALLAPKSPA